MRKHTIIILMLAFVMQVNAQRVFQLPVSQPPELTCIAGNDTTVCPGHPIQLGGSPTANGGTGTLLYTWSPPNYLDDPTSPNPMTSALESTTYMLTVTDETGCIVRNFVRIIVDPCLGTGGIPLHKSLLIFPNPAREKVYIGGFGQVMMGEVIVEIIGSIGQVFTAAYKLGEMSEGVLEVPIHFLVPGTYYIRVIAGGSAIVKPLQILER